MGAEHGANKDRTTWKERQQAEAESLGSTTQPYVLVIGGGQGGIALGARLRQLGVPSLVIDKHARPGDQWRSRYKSLCLHDPVWYDHLPYLKFPDNWPVFAPKDKIGDWLESYTRVMEVPYWSSTDGHQRVVLRGDRGVDRRGRARRPAATLRPKQLVLATGMSGKPNIPDLPGQDVFRGDQHHSSAHPGPDAYAGKKVVVIGSNNSAFDICGALWEHDADVTMVQRSSTHIVKSDTLMDIGLGDLYSERAVAAGVTTEKADLIFASLPYRIMHEFQIPLYEQMAERDKDFYDRLEQAGFDHDWGDDGSGLFMKYLRRGSGYYIDVGSADLVANGDVKLVHGQVDHLTEDSVVLADGTELPADLVVYATGYGSMNGWAADLISQEVADQLGQGVGPGVRDHQGPRSVGGRAAQHVEADPGGEPLDARRQPAPVAPLLALPGAPAQGPLRGDRHPGLRPAGGAPHELSRSLRGRSTNCRSGCRGPTTRRSSGHLSASLRRLPRKLVRHMSDTRAPHPAPTWWAHGLTNLAVVLAVTFGGWYLLNDPEMSPLDVYPFPFNAALFWALLFVVWSGFNLEFAGFTRLAQPLRGIAITVATVVFAVVVTWAISAGIGHFYPDFAASRDGGTGYFAGALFVLFGFSTYVLVVVNWAHWPWTDLGLKQPLLACARSPSC